MSVSLYVVSHRPQREVGSDQATSWNNKTTFPALYKQPLYTPIMQISGPRIFHTSWSDLTIPGARKVPSNKLHTNIRRPRTKFSFPDDLAATVSAPLRYITILDTHLHLHAPLYHKDKREKPWSFQKKAALFGQSDIIPHCTRCVYRTRLRFQLPPPSLEGRASDCVP